MSIALMSQVFYIEALKGAHKLLLLALADHADSEGRCHPSIERLAVKTSVSKRQCMNNLGVLEREGWLRRIRTPGLRNRYELDVAKIAASSQQPQRASSVLCSDEQAPEPVSPQTPPAAPAIGEVTPIEAAGSGGATRACCASCPMQDVAVVEAVAPVQASAEVVQSSSSEPVQSSSSDPCKEHHLTPEVGFTQTPNNPYNNHKKNHQEKRAHAFDPQTVELPASFSRSLFVEFCQMRLEKGRPLTQRNVDLMAKEHQGLEARCLERMFEKAIAEEWMRIYPLKDYELEALRPKEGLEMVSSEAEEPLNIMDYLGRGLVSLEPDHAQASRLMGWR